MNFMGSHIKRFSTKRILSNEFHSVLLNEFNRIITDDTNYKSIDNFDFNNNDVKANSKILKNWVNLRYKRVSSILWFIPPFLAPFAGINNILNIASFLQNKGIEQRFVLLGDREVCNLCEKNFRIGAHGNNFKNIKIYKNPKIDQLEYADISFATRWDTAFSVLKFKNTKGKFYFIQEDERLLFPGTIFRDLAQLTYTFGFIGITNALELKRMYNNEFHGKAGYYFPVPDKIFFTNRKNPRSKIKSIWFYARTRSERNGFHLGILTLRQIKDRHPELKIYLAGEKSIKSHADFDYVDVGDIKDPKELSKFYSKCDVGIYLLFSKHTGVIPFELMASGCITLTNRKLYKTYALKNGFNCIMGDPIPKRLAESFDKIYYDIELRKKIFKNGLETVKGTSKEKELQKVYEYIVGIREPD